MSMAWKMSIVSSILQKKSINNIKSTFTDEPFPRGKAHLFMETPIRSVAPRRHVPQTQS